MTTREVAEAFAALCREGKHEEAGERFWAPTIRSREAMEGPMADISGLEAVRQKTAWWNANHEVHGGTTEGPFVNGDSFTLVFQLDVTAKQTGQRIQMREVALYTVADGKVVEERFFY